MEIFGYCKLIAYQKAKKVIKRTFFCQTFLIPITMTPTHKL